MRRAWLWLGVLGLWPRTALGAQQCVGSVQEFNSFMDQQLSSASSVTLSFEVTGVNLDDYLNGKGWLAELADTRCSAGLAVASLKVYGSSSPLNTAHPPGTMKLEYGSACCITGTCPVEYWAEPMPGPPIFSQPSQVCSVVETLTPATISWDIQCDGGTAYHAEGANHDGMPVDRAAVLSEVGGGHAMANATASKVQICFELAGAPVGSETVDVMEDVTVAPQFPTSVYPDPNDLACGAGDGTTYLKFSLASVAGSVKQATLYVHSGTDPSSAGTGADVRAVADTAWSESSLTWNARPALGTQLGRLDGVTPDSWYTVDVSSAISGPGVFAFALAPATTDTDTAHFLSKEASASLKPHLLLQVIDGDAGPGSGGSAGTNDGGSAASGGWSGSAGSISKQGGATGQSSGGTTEDTSGCSCSAVGGDARDRLAVWVLLALSLIGAHRSRR